MIITTFLLCFDWCFGLGQAWFGWFWVSMGLGFRFSFFSLFGSGLQDLS
jgi:hypothetical protein